MTGFQPYRRGPRVAGPALTAMLRGRTVFGFNPADLERGTGPAKATSSSRARTPRRPRRPRKPR